MTGWVIPFALFLIFDVAVMVELYKEEKEKTKFNHDLPNIVVEKDEDNDEDELTKSDDTQ